MVALAARAAPALVLLIAGCGGGDGKAPAGPGPTSTTTRDVAPIALRSPAFAAGAAIPRAYTCDGRDRPPPLRWSAPPPRTAELVLVLRDPDAPSGSFVHWAVAGLDARVSSLGGTAQLPRGAVEGRNDFGVIGYKGPCPPHGARPHRYALTIYALPRRSGLLAGAVPGANVLASAVGAGSLSGTYGR
jgi:Raf kinase inhibitor-like YbhB/YbcL family protein